ncbi:MAG TPA: GNAT family N-acetyltransferase [Vineibacter sp.]|nr:GNAT family N-acetyltransferase [Vineibacter sp.]
MGQIEIRIEAASSPAAGALIAALDDELRRRYPDEPTNGIDAESFEADGGVFAVGYVGGEPAACGAFRPYEKAAEIKRMFVASAFRGRGLGRLMLLFLEREAARRGFARAVLETGTGQPEAIHLYSAQGWQPIPAFGSYVGNPLSVCFEKQLGDAPGPAGQRR